MKTLTFKYTDAKGKESSRVLLVSAEPTDLISGTDITVLEPQDQVQYIDEVAAAKAIYLERIKELNQEFDINFSFRQFKPANMKDVITEDI